jgi:hypothetical protein
MKRPPPNAWGQNWEDYSMPYCPDLEEVPDPWLIPAIDTRRPWEYPVLARIGVSLAYDLIAGGSQ